MKAHRKVLADLLESPEGAKRAIIDIYSGTPEEIERYWDEATKKPPRDAGEYLVRRLVELRPEPRVERRLRAV